jgi:hypothetical protein
MGVTQRLRLARFCEQPLSFDFTVRTPHARVVPLARHAFEMGVTQRLRSSGYVANRQSCAFAA